MKSWVDRSRLGRVIVHACNKLRSVKVEIPPNNFFFGIDKGNKNNFMFGELNSANLNYLGQLNSGGICYVRIIRLLQGQSDVGLFSIAACRSKISKKRFK